MWREITRTERLLLLLVFLILFVGVVLFLADVQLFEVFVREDSIVEWITVVALGVGSYICLFRFFTLFSSKNAWFLLVTLAIGLVIFAGMGEELSWGQRIFNIETSEFFREHNKQQETNIHNLVICGVKLNKVIFSLGLGLVLAVYLLVVPILYERWIAFRKFIDRSGVMIATNYQIIAIFTAAAVSQSIAHSKRDELTEACVSLLFILIILYPRNKGIYMKSSL